MISRRSLIGGVGAAGLVRPAWSMVKPWTGGRVALGDHGLHRAIEQHGGAHVITHNGDHHFLDHVNFTPPPNDPNYVNQYHMAQCSIPQAWLISQGSTSTIIAMMGSGVTLPIDNPVSQLTGTNEPTGTTNTNDVYSGSSGHDSITADLAMATTNEGAGSAGVCPNATLLPVVVLASNQSISNLNVGLALDFVAAAGAHIVSCSFVINNFGNPFLTPHALGVWNAGGIIVSSTDETTTPCGVNYDLSRQPNVIACGAVDSSDNLASFGCSNSTSMVMAPGVNICATDKNGTSGCGVNGTSFSTPIVAGVCGLMRTANSKFTLRNDEIYKLMLQNGLDAIGGQAGWPTLDVSLGYGRVNALKAVTAAYGYVRPFFVRAAPFGGL